MIEGRRLTDFIEVDIEIKKVRSGSFGIVYMGPNRLRNGEWIALKTLLPEVLAASPRTRSLFIREALTWVGLWPHPNIITGIGMTEIKGQPFLELEYAENGTLRNILTIEQPFASRLLWAQNIAAGLAALHTPDPEFLRPTPLVHRDLKPSNVLMSERGIARIADFGLAKIINDNAAGLHEVLTSINQDRSTNILTKRGQIVGTMAYMAPEQWKDPSAAGTPADMYAFGLILSELLAGRHALLDLDTSHSPAQWQYAHEKQQPRPLREVNADLPREMEDLYRSCLAKKPRRRPTAQQALGVLQDVARKLDQEPYMLPENFGYFTRTPDNKYAIWESWATAHLRLSLYQEGLDRIASALKLLPSVRDSLRNAAASSGLRIQADCLSFLGRAQEALATYRDALAAAPPENRLDRWMIWNNLSVLYLRTGRHAEAEASFEQALSLQPDNGLGWINRASNSYLWAEEALKVGNIAEATNHLKQAERYTQRAIAADSGDSRYSNLLAAVRQRLREVQGSV